MGGLSGNALEGASPAPGPRLPTGEGAMVWQCTGTTTHHEEIRTATYHEENGNKIIIFIVSTPIHVCSYIEVGEQRI